MEDQVKKQAMDEVFDKDLKQAMGKRQQEKAEEQSRTTYTPEDKMPLLVNKYRVVRIVNVPVPVYYSFIVCDDKKRRMFKFPSKSSDENFLLYRITDKVLEKTFIGRDDENKAIYEFPMKKSHPEVFKLIHNNGSDKYDKYGPKGWVKEYGDPEQAFYINIINRQEFSITRKDKDDNQEIINYPADWCEKENHTLLLVKAMSAIGVPVTLNNMLLDVMASDYGSFIEYDVAIKRLNKDPWYQMAKAENLTQGEDKETSEYTVRGPLTEKEIEYKKYDLREMSKVSTYKFIFKYLKNKIAFIDDELGTDYSVQLERKVEEEAASGMTEIEAEVEVENALGSESGQEKDPNQQSRVQVQTRQPSSLNIEELKKLAPHIDKLSSDQMKKSIKGIEGEDKDAHIVFNDSALAKCMSTSCNKLQPMVLTKFCIFCNYTFPE